MGHGLPSFCNEGTPCRSYQGEIVLGYPETWPFDRPRVIRADPGPRSVIAKFAAMQMTDVHVPTTDGRELLLTRYTEPDAELRLLLDKLKLALPAQSPPKITTAQMAPQPPP
jgi:hypothetical protein